MKKPVIEIVRHGGDHPICNPLQWKKLPRWPRQFLEDHCLNTTDEVVTATHRGDLVGFVRMGYGVLSRSTLHEGGTWVAKPYRRDHLALSMWVFMLQAPRRFKVTAVNVVCLNAPSVRLVQRVSERFPKIAFHVDSQVNIERALR